MKNIMRRSEVTPPQTLETSDSPRALRLGIQLKTSKPLKNFFIPSGHLPIYYFAINNYSDKITHLYMNRENQNFLKRTSTDKVLLPQRNSSKSSLEKNVAAQTKRVAYNDQHAKPVQLYTPPYSYSLYD